MSPENYVKFLEAENKLLKERLLVDFGEPHVKHCIEHSDSLVVHGEPRYGNLYGLEWMLRSMVGSYLRQKQYTEQLERKLSGCF